MTEPTDAEIIALNDGEIHFSESQTKYPEAGHGTQYHAGDPGVLSFARAVLAKWGGSPVVAVEPWGASVGDRVWVGKLPAHVPKLAEVEGLSIQWLYTTPQPTQAQAGAVPLTPDQISAMTREHPAEDLCGWSYRMGVADGERHHGIKQGGQHAD